MKSSQTTEIPIARQNGLVIQEHDGEVLVYDIDTNKAHCLNSTAATVWRSCDGVNSIEDIVREFESLAGGQGAADLVWLAIDQLAETGLLANSISPRFAGQSRRQVIKKIGLASVIALPVIASLVAPSSVLANVSCACVVPADCAGTGCPSTTNCNGSGVCAT